MHKSIVWFHCKIVKGYGIASGIALDTPYPYGSIEMQEPFFLELGLDISIYWKATLNLSFFPYNVDLKLPDYFFRNIKWTNLHPPEDFSFWNIYIRGIKSDQTIKTGLLYRPDPKTKLLHHHSASIVEVITDKIDINYGDTIQLGVNKNCIKLYRP